MSPPTTLVVLDGVPAPTFASSVTYLADVLRECQLMLLDREQGTAVDGDLAALAERLVPQIQEIRTIFRRSERLVADDLVRLTVGLVPADADLMAEIQANLARLRVLGHRGGLLVADEPEVSRFWDWACDEVADQLAGRLARSFPPRGVDPLAR